MEIWQNSQDNTYARGSLIKIQASARVAGLQEIQSVNIQFLFADSIIISVIWKSVWMFKARGYGCSFVAKLTWNKNFFFWKNICVFYKIYIICRKKCFYMEKKFYNENVFYWKKTFFTEKNINENVKNIYLISEIYFYTENVCVTNKI